MDQDWSPGEATSTYTPITGFEPGSGIYSVTAIPRLRERGFEAAEAAGLRVVKSPRRARDPEEYQAIELRAVRW
jgi:hypothetical protein